jgi:signal transduction histidine kinase
VLSPRFRQHPGKLVAIEVATAAGITLLTVYGTILAALRLPSGTVLVVWLVALAVSVPLALRRRWPIPVFGCVLASSIVAVLLGMSRVATAVAVAIALYLVALSGGKWRAVVALGAALMGLTLAAVFASTVFNPRFLLITPSPQAANTDLTSSLSFIWLTIGAAWIIGRSYRARLQYASQIAEHRAQQAVSEERLRIAREMHDVVAHSISVIVMKAAVANHVYDTRPEESREALSAIESVGRAALADIERVLGTLRAGGEADLAPSPGLDELPRLIENAQLAGVDVKFDRGIIPALPAAVQLTVYRIVQEALTNVIKHAKSLTQCTVRVTAESGELHLAVIDDGVPYRSVGESGHGLIGMRERAALHRGTLVADWQPSGGFAVHVRLPY